MNNTKITCLPTKWFFMRIISMGLIFIGFGLYFFYDATIGYPAQNKDWCIYQTFVEASKQFNTTSFTPDSWAAHIKTQTVNFTDLPIPKDTARLQTPWPAELANYQAMNQQGWNAIWIDYSAAHHLPYKVAEVPFHSGKIIEQKIAGLVCFCITLLCLGLFIRTKQRRMSISGDTIIASGKQFKVSDITLIDMRKWKNKGLAHATVTINNHPTKIRLDGLTYGGFDKNIKDTKNASIAKNTAEHFMSALLAVYSGEILDYADTPDQQS
ncbi:MAG: hypothetical protein RSE01_01625 [Akkermansia sp.]